jgi:hypothetical protein
MIIKLWNYNFHSFFSCDSLIFIKNYDQHSLKIILHVEVNGYVWFKRFLIHSKNNIQFWNKIKQNFE